MTDEAAPASTGGGGPYQSVPALTINSLQSGGPHQQGAQASAVSDLSGGPHQQGVQAAGLVLQSGGPHQAVPATAGLLQSGGPHQQTDDALVIGDVTGSVEGRAAGGRAHTRPGGLGIAVETVEAGERPTLNLSSTRSIRWGGRQLAGGQVDLIPLVDGVIDITDRLLLDATLAAFNTDLQALWNWAPPGSSNVRRLIVTEVLFRPLVIAGLTSHPIFDLGGNAPTFNNTKAGMDLGSLGGAAVGSCKRYLVTPNAESYREDTESPAMTLRLTTPAVATTYSVEVLVRGYYTRPALLDS